MAPAFNASIGDRLSVPMAAVTVSISGPQLTAFFEHAQRCGARSHVVLCAFPQGRRQRMNSLAMMKLALSVLLESSSIAISFRHTVTLSCIAGILPYLFAHLAVAERSDGRFDLKSIPAVVHASLARGVWLSSV
jgi:hypothetical protein